MKNTGTMKIGGERLYVSPALEVINFQMETGFCQSGGGKGRTEDLMEEDLDFEWQ